MTLPRVFQCHWEKCSDTRYCFAGRATEFPVYSTWSEKRELSGMSPMILASAAERVELPLLESCRLRKQEERLLPLNPT